MERASTAVQDKSIQAEATKQDRERALQQKGFLDAERQQVNCLAQTNPA